MGVGGYLEWLGVGGEGEDVVDLVGLVADSHGAADAGEDGDVVELGDEAAEADPVGEVAVSEVEDEEAAAGCSSVALEVGLQFEAGEGASLA